MKDEFKEVNAVSEKTELSKRAGAWGLLAMTAVSMGAVYSSPDVKTHDFTTTTETSAPATENNDDFIAIEKNDKGENVIKVTAEKFLDGISSWAEDREKSEKLQSIDDGVTISKNDAQGCSGPVDSNEPSEVTYKGESSLDDTFTIKQNKGGDYSLVINTGGIFEENPSDISNVENYNANFDGSEVSSEFIPEILEDIDKEGLVTEKNDEELVIEEDIDEREEDNSEDDDFEDDDS